MLGQSTAYREAENQRYAKPRPHVRHVVARAAASGTRPRHAAPAFSVASRRRVDGATSAEVAWRTARAHVAADARPVQGVLTAAAAAVCALPCAARLPWRLRYAARGAQPSHKCAGSRVSVSSEQGEPVAVAGTRTVQNAGKRHRRRSRLYQIGMVGRGGRNGGVGGSGRQVSRPQAERRRCMAPACRRMNNERLQRGEHQAGTPQNAVVAGGSGRAGIQQPCSTTPNKHVARQRERCTARGKECQPRAMQIARTPRRVRVDRKKNGHTVVKGAEGADALMPRPRQEEK